MSNLNNKQLMLIDGSAFSGSTEALRNELGTYWHTVLIDRNNDGTEETTTDFTYGVGIVDAAISPQYTDPESYLQSDLISSISERLRYVELQPAFQTTASSDTIAPNFKIPGRFYGNETKLRSDTEWKAYLLGGTYGEQTYPGIYSTDTFDDYGTDYKLPYTMAEYNSLVAVSDHGWQSSSIAYYYNQYLPKFETWAANTPIKSMPSVAFMELLHETSASKFPVEELVSRDGAYPMELNDILTTDITTALPPRFFEADPTSNTYIDTTHNLRDYLNDLSSYPLSNETKAGVSFQTRNIFYDKDAANILFGGQLGGDARKILRAFPSYVSLDFYRDNNEETHFRDAFDQGHFSVELLTLLKTIFGNDQGESKLFRTRTLFVEPTDGSLYTTETLENTTFKTADLISALAALYTSLPRSLSDTYVLTDDNDDEFSLGNTTTTSTLDSTRFLTSYSVMTTLTRMLSLLDSEYTPFPDDLNHFDINLTGKNGIYALLQKAGTPNYKETVAYRVEKKDASGTIQNIWFYNDRPTSVNESIFQYHDSQVKYGETYTYNIYAYVLTTGMKYRMADLRISRNIGTGSLVVPQDAVCLQFHDAATDEVVDQLFASSEEKWNGTGYNGSEYHGVYNDLAASNTFSSNAQALSRYPYVADFNLYYEPSLRLLEIPVASNTLTILDNPTPGLDVVPFQKIDNSQKIGFYIQAEVHQPSATFPAPIQSSDLEYKTNYLQSHGLSDSDKISASPVSDQAFIEIYRMDTRPSAYTDFDNYLYKTISLKIRDNMSTDVNYYSPTSVFEDKIETNKKYYYVMRLLNEHREPGAPSAIIQAELIDDGGYKYALFNELFSEDLVENTFVNPSVPFKKLFQIIPDFKQLSLNTSNVDFDDTAASQLGNLTVGDSSIEESIFDQTFKIRLTSKKTGKKIDLNLTFNLMEEA